MGAHLTSYCLEQITDYFEFEELCHDLMINLGYLAIEPLGGFSDKGRDAVHHNRNEKETTIFAYSVREDWRSKLSEDAGKIKGHEHDCDNLVFITTADFSAGERDQAILSIKEEFGWELDLFGLKRLRLLLDARFPEIKYRYPQIFPPEFLAVQKEIDKNLSKPENVLILHSAEDAPFVEWLARKLIFDGYRVLAEKIPIDQIPWPEDLDTVFDEQVYAVVPVLSDYAILNPDFIGGLSSSVTLAKKRDYNSVIPVFYEFTEGNNSPKSIVGFSSIQFVEKWTNGLQNLLDRLDSIKCPKPVLNGKTLATRDLIKEHRLKPEPEILFSNCFSIIQIPTRIYGYVLSKSASPKKIEDLDFRWAFRRASSKLYFSFEDPPIELAEIFHVKQRIPYRWDNLEEIEGISSQNLISELIRKSLLVHLKNLGLNFCSENKLHYFSEEVIESGRLKFKHPISGDKSFVNAFGRRKYWKPDNEEYYRYQLAPSFRVVRDLFDNFTVLLRLFIRLTDDEGILLSQAKKVSRRKHLCKNWWNHDWGNRILAVSQFLSEESEIIIGPTDNQLIIAGAPLMVTSPVSINEDEFTGQEDREELLYAFEYEEE